MWWLLACATAPSLEPAQSGVPAGYEVHGKDQRIEDQFASALAAARSGDTEEAERLGSEVVERTVADPTSGYLVAVAWHNLATLRFGLHDRTGAIEALTRAVEVPASDDEERKAHLAYQMNLADFLVAEGRVDEGVARADENLRERESFYPAGHPGLAYGHTVVATSRLAAGDGPGALLHANTAWQIYHDTQHFEIASAEVVRAQSRVAAGHPAPRVDVTSLVDPERVLDAVRAAQLRPGWADLLPVVAELRDVWGANDAGREAARLQFGLARRARSLPDTLDALDWLEANSPAEGADTLATARALALSDAGKLLEAEAAFTAALAAAADGDARARVYLQTGLFFDQDLGPTRAADARAHLDAAAASATDPELKARSQVALGVFCAHHNDRPAAEAALTSGLRALPATHPDAITARNHLRGLSEGRCGCEDQDLALASTLEAYAEERVPGLVARVTVVADHAPVVELARPATPEEERVLAGLLRRVVAENSRLSAATYGTK